MSDKIGKEVTYTSLEAVEITGKIVDTYGDHLVVEIKNSTTGKQDEELMPDPDKSKK